MTEGVVLKTEHLLVKIEPDVRCWFDKELENSALFPFEVLDSGDTHIDEASVVWVKTADILRIYGSDNTSIGMLHQDDVYAIGNL